MRRKGLLVAAMALILFSQVIGVFAQAKAGTASSVIAENKFKNVKADYTLKFSLQEPSADNPEYKAAVAFKNYVESQTGGKVQIQLFPSAQLGNEREIVEAIKAGNVDLGTSAEGPVAGFVPEVSVLSIPYLFKAGPVAWKVLSGPFGEELKELIFKKGKLRVLAFGMNGFRSFTNSRKPIYKVEDLKGLKIRVMQDKTYVAMVNALGAMATPMAGGNELYSALQQKVVDGQENPLDGIYAYKLYEQQPYITVDAHTYSTKFLFADDKKLKSMPRDYQLVIINGARVWQSHLEGPKETASVESYFLLKDLVKEIYTLPPSEKERFRAAAQPAVIDYMKGTIGSEWIDKVQEAVKQAELEIYGN
jgi:tripartite ATP-independent transporter DctP family solute receptor